MPISDILTRFRTDPEFAARYIDLTDTAAIQSQLVADGYDVTLDDIHAGIDQLTGNSGELSEAELARVAGGATEATTKQCSRCGSRNLSHDNYRLDKTKNAHFRIWTCENCGATQIEYR